MEQIEPSPSSNSGFDFLNH